MSKPKSWQVVTVEPSATETVAERIGQALKGGEVIELRSDLGGGKTTFTRGLARGAGSKDRVASPTFTISKVYKAPSFDIHHFDFYRLHEPGIMADELAEIAHDPQAVTVIEWADIAQHVLPESRLSLTISQLPDGSRELTFQCPEELLYLMKDVKDKVIA